MNFPIRFIISSSLMFTMIWVHATIKANKTIPVKAVIHKIIIQTENKKLKLNIEKQLSKYLGKTLSSVFKKQIQDELLTILKQKKILQPDIEGPFFHSIKTKTTVIYRIKNPYQYALIFKNNKAVPDHAILTQAIRQTIFNLPNWENKLIQHIKSSYVTKGYAKTKVVYHIETNHTLFTKLISFTIQEGKLLKIKSIQMLGTFSKPPEYYIQLIRKHSGKLMRKNIFYNQDLQAGIKYLANTLRYSGYLEPNIYSKTTEKSGKIIITIILNEGVLTKVKNIQFKGNKYFSNKQLKRLTRSKKNTPLKVQWIKQDIENIIHAYKNAGFININLNKNNIVQYSPDSSKAYIQFNIIENTQFIITRIGVQGNIFTKSNFILKSANLKIGDILTPKKINQTIEKLRQLGIFTFIDIVTIDTNQKNSLEHTVIIKVKERKKRSFRLAGGLNTERLFTGYGRMQLAHKNISGSGRQIFTNIKLQSNIARYIYQDISIPKHMEHQGSIIYNEPFILRSLFNGQVSVSNASNISLYNTKNNSLSVVNSNKFNFLLQKEIQSGIHLQWTLLSWEGRKEFEKSIRCQNTSKTISSDNTCVGNTLNMAGTRIALNIDKRNKPVSTSNGFLSNIFSEYIGPLYWIHGSPKVHFIKLELRHFDFRPIFSKLVWLNSIQGGMIVNLNNNKEGGFPVSHAFILGGVDSLRGFDGLLDGQRVPNKEEWRITGSNQLISSAASFFFLFKTELRFPIKKNINGSIFYDGGSVAISGRKFETPYRQSIGFGLRYQTILGSLSAYIAFKIAPKKNESLYLPHLSFGSF